MKKTPIEYFIDYLKLNKVDDTYYLVSRPTMHQDFIDIVKKYEQEYINFRKNKNKNR